MKKRVIYVQRTLPILINPKTGRYYSAGDIIYDINDMLEQVAIHNPHAFSIIEIDDSEVKEPAKTEVKASVPSKEQSKVEEIKESVKTEETIKSKYTSEVKTDTEQLATDEKQNADSKVKEEVTASDENAPASSDSTTVQKPKYTKQYKQTDKSKSNMTKHEN